MAVKVGGLVGWLLNVLFGRGDRATRRARRRAQRRRHITWLPRWL